MPSPTFTASDTGQRSVGDSTMRLDNGAHHASAVSWSAVLAGAAATAALSLILLVLGTGLGLSSVSPWTDAGISAVQFGISTILWLTLTQLVASAMGGYIAGRLRTRWAGVDSDEVYFRDTAHGFLSWAVASLATAALLTGVVSSILGGSVKAGAALAGSAVTASAAVAGAQGARDGQGDNTGYFVDALFRTDASAPAAATTATPVVATTDAAAQERSNSASASESTRIFRAAMAKAGPLPVEDVRHLGQVVARRTGLGQAEAEKRVTDTYTRLQTSLSEAELAARDTADKARKLAMKSALWLFVGLLLGAFAASFSATLGGRQRDA